MGVQRWSRCKYRKASEGQSGWQLKLLFAMKSGKPWDDKAERALMFQRRILGLIGVWPLDAKSTSATMRWLLCVAIEMSTLTSFFLEIYRHCGLTRSTIDWVVELLSSFLSLLKMILCRYSGKHIRDLVEGIYEDWSTEKNEAYQAIMLTFVSRYRLVSVSLFYLIISTGICLITSNMPIFLPGDANKTQRRFVLETYCVFDNTSDFYYLVFAVQIVQLTVQMICHSGMDGFFFSLTMHLCGQFIILNKDYAAINVERMSWYEASGRVIKKHRRLSKMADSLESGFNLIIMVQMLGSVLMLCTAGFQLIYSLTVNETFHAAKNAFIIVSLMVQLFLFTSAADMLQSNSERLAYSAYECAWYNFGAKAAKDLPLIILRASIPHRLTAGKFIVMNLLTFQSIVRMSASYMSVLRVMIEV